MIAPTTPTGSRTSRPNSPASGLGRLLERERGGQVGERVEGHLRAGPAEAGDGVQHAGLARPDLAEVVAAPGQLGADGAQDPGPFGMSQPRPGAAVERLPRGLDRPGYVKGRPSTWQG
jgi:hypothetical protein